MTYDIHFHFDPICPFAWITSKWVRQVADARHYAVDWRFISLRIINKNVDYDSHFPPGYAEGHERGLQLLRVCAAARAAHGRDVMGDLYAAISSGMFDVAKPDDPKAHQRHTGSHEYVSERLGSVGLPIELADALHDPSWDAEIEQESEAVLALTGRDVGTPIIQIEPPDGPALFGPVISRLPSDEDAVELWEHVTALARFPGFAELKRSMRERPQLRVMGIDPGQVGQQEDWHAGSRRLKK